MDCKHTPGPWVVSAKSRTTIKQADFLGETNVLVASASGHPNSGLFPTDEEAIHNAHLIAAAPDLLDACRVMLDHVGYASCESSVQRQGLQKMLRAAIAKATGQTGA